VHQFSNPDLQHSSTEDTISNQSVNLTVSAICLTSRHMACFFLLHLFTYVMYKGTTTHLVTCQPTNT